MCDREKIRCREKMRGLVSRTGNRRARLPRAAEWRERVNRHPWPSVVQLQDRMRDARAPVGIPTAIGVRATTVLYGLSIAPHVRSAGHHLTI